MHSIKESVSILLFSLLIAISMGIFLFDKTGLIYKRASNDTTIIYKSIQNLSPLFQYLSFCFIGISTVLIILSLHLKSKKNFTFLYSLKRQAITFVPFLFLVFGRFFDGKAVHYIFFLPLFPIILFIILASVIHLNILLHFDVNVFRSCYAYLKNHSRTKNILLIISLLFILSSMLIQILVTDFHFEKFTGSRLFSGDEPKYLRMAYSLATDKDLDVSDEFVIEEGLERAKERILKSGSRSFGSLSIIGIDGGIYHLHLPGLSVLIFPGFFLDLSFFPEDPEISDPFLSLKGFPSKLFFTRLWLLAIGLLSFLFFARLIYKFFGSIFLLVLLPLLYIFCSPVPKFMFQLYPEFAACFFTLLVLNAILFPFKIRYSSEIFVILGLGFLPWLHQRFIFLAFSLYLIFVIREIFIQKKYKKFLIVTLLLIIMSLPYLYYFYSITGSPMPNSMHKLYGTTFTRVGMFPLGFFGHLFHHSKGIIWLFPWTALAFIGIYRGLKSDRTNALMLLLLLAPYFLMTCFHIAWHGMVREPGRYLVAIFPLLLFFLGYTIQTFMKRPTYPQLFLYFFILTFILLNTKFWFLFFNFGGPYIKNSQLIQMVICVSIIGLCSLLVAVTNGLDKRKWSQIFWEKHLGYLKRYSHEKARRFSPIKTRKCISYLLLFLWMAYLVVYMGNWNKKMMAFPLISTLNRMKSTGYIRLIEIENPMEIIKKTDNRFIQIFRNTYGFLLKSSPEKTQISLGKTPFYERIPRGCYKVNITTDNHFEKNMNIALQFMQTKKELKFRKEKNAYVASATFFLYQDRYISPNFYLECENLGSKKISGTLEIAPLPSLNYGKNLILRPIPISNPKTVRKKGEDQYNLVFVANTDKAKVNIKFLLYTQKYPGSIDRENEILLSQKEVRISKKKNPLRVAMGFRISPDFLKEKSGLALFALNENGKTLPCQSLWLNAKKTYWNLMKMPESSFNRIIFSF
jgi:hypothetical protein